MKKVLILMIVVSNLISCKRNKIKEDVTVIAILNKEFATEDDYTYCAVTKPNGDTLCPILIHDSLTHKSFPPFKATMEENKGFFDITPNKIISLK